MEGFNAQQVINGTWGELWVDDQYMAEVKSVKAEVTATYSDIVRTRHLINGKKLTALEGAGEFKLHKVSSTIMKKVSDCFKAGKTPSVTIKTKISDPDNGGVEQVALYNCTLDKAILADWEAGSNAEETYSFTFDSWEILDSI